MTVQPSVAEIRRRTAVMPAEVHFIGMVCTWYLLRSTVGGWGATFHRSSFEPCFNHVENARKHCTLPGNIYIRATHDEGYAHQCRIARSPGHQHGAAMFGVRDAGGSRAASKKKGN